MDESADSSLTSASSAQETTFADIVEDLGKHIRALDERAETSRQSNDIAEQQAACLEKAKTILDLRLNFALRVKHAIEENRLSVPETAKALRALTPGGVIADAAEKWAQRLKVYETMGARELTRGHMFHIGTVLDPINSKNELERMAIELRAGELSLDTNPRPRTLH